MPNDTLTMVLEGVVTMEDYAQAITRFSAPVAALQREVSAGDSIEWIIQELHAGQRLRHGAWFRRRARAGRASGAGVYGNRALPRVRGADPVPWSGHPRSPGSLGGPEWEDHGDTIRDC